MCYWANCTLWQVQTKRQMTWYMFVGHADWWDWLLFFFLCCSCIFFSLLICIFFQLIRIWICIGFGFCLFFIKFHNYFWLLLWYGNDSQMKCNYQRIFVTAKYYGVCDMWHYTHVLTWSTAGKEDEKCIVIVYYRRSRIAQRVYVMCLLADWLVGWFG